VNVNSAGPSGVGLTINVPLTTPPGNYTVTVVASWRGISRMLSIIISVRSAAPAASTPLVGLVALVPLLAVMSRSTVSRARRVSRSWVFHRTQPSSSPGFRRQDLVRLLRRG
jgi:hypothetical protein